MAEANPSGGMRPWLRLVLFASLALNLAVAGLVAGAVLRGGPDVDRRAPRGDDPVTPYARAFTEGQRRDLGRALRGSFIESARTGEGARPDLTGDYRAALEILRGDPFEPGALEGVLDRQADRAEARRRRGQDVLTGYLAAMTPRERAEFADRLEAEIARLEERRARWRRD